jgi:hypothetical protein
VLGHEYAHALDGLHGHAPADPKAAYEFSIVDGAPTEGRFRHTDSPAVVGDFAQQLFGRHALPPLPCDCRLRYYKAAH